MLLEGQNKDGLKIGILGGSYNPAHEGHLYISLKALELLGLDEVWWLVSPQNPLKSKEEMAPFEKRFNSAKKIVNNHKKIIISDLEVKFNTNYSFDTIDKLQKSFSKTNFVWLIGADNLLQFPKWKKWNEIFNMIPIAVFDRNAYSSSPFECEAAEVYCDYLIKDENDLKNITMKKAPAWAFMGIKKHPASSTKIREMLDKKDIW